MRTNTSIMLMWLIWLIVLLLVWLGGLIFAALLSRATDRDIRASVYFSTWAVLIASLVIIGLGLLLRSIIAIEFGGISAALSLLLLVTLRSTRRHPLIPGHRYATWSPAAQHSGSLRNTVYRLVNLAAQAPAERLDSDLREVVRDYPHVSLVNGLCAAVSWSAWKIINNPYQPADRPADYQGHNLDSLLSWIASSIIFPNPELAVPYARSLTIMQGACLKQPKTVDEETLLNDLRDLVTLLTGLADLLVKHYDMSLYDSWVEKMAEQAETQCLEGRS